MPNIQQFCESCIKFIPAFRYCTRFHLIVTEESCCQQPTPGEPSRYHQFSKWMEDNMEKSIFAYDFDDLGWLNNIRLKGIDDVPPYRPTREYDTTIPQSLIHPRMYCQICSRSNTICVQPGHGKVIVIETILNPQTFKLYKLYNGAVGKPVSFIMPELLVDIKTLYRIITAYLYLGRQNVQPELLNYEKALSFWKSLGYPTFEFQNEDYTTEFMLYEYDGREAVVSDNRIPPDMVETADITIAPTGDRTPLERFQMEGRCFSCGFPYTGPENEGPPNPTICPFCQLKQPETVFSGVHDLGEI